MPPELWAEFRSSLADALVADRVVAETVDRRLKGSAAEAFSGPHKAMPTVESLRNDLEAGTITPEEHNDAVRRLTEMMAGEPGEALVSRPFDVMYRLGLDERSDYDLNFSSDIMFRRALALWDSDRHGQVKPDGGRDVPVGPAHSNHGYLFKALATEAFPSVAAWAERWQGRLGRDISWAVFLGGGPDDTTHRPGHRGMSVHFRPTDWIIQ
jgi:hypothetical protein